MSVPVGTPKGRATRLPDDDRPALTGSSFVSTGRRTLNRLPDLFKVRGGATPPLLDQGVGAPFFAGAKNRLRLPRQLTDPVGWVRYAGLRLDALPQPMLGGSQKGADCLITGLPWNDKRNVYAHSHFLTLAWRIAVDRTDTALESARTQGRVPRSGVSTP